MVAKDSLVAFESRHQHTYDAWLLFQYTDKCFLDCRYCGTNTVSKFLSHLSKPKAIPTDALLQSLQDTGLRFKITFTGGGEPFLIPNLIDTCIRLQEEHYLGFASNLVTGNIERFSENIRPERVIRFKASLHIEQLLEKKLFETFCKRYHILKEKGFPIDVVQVAYPDFVSKVSSFNRIMASQDVPFSYEPYVGYFDGDHYPESYAQDELQLFGLYGHKKEKNPVEPVEENNFNKDTICNCGYNVGFVRKNGVVYGCSHYKERLGSIKEGFSFHSKTKTCTQKICYCPVRNFDPYLYEKATTFFKK
jgi:organic radical activating enzyme